MFLLIVSCIVFSTHTADSITIPYLNNATLKTGSLSAGTFLPNKTCAECLCLSLMSSHSALNCFSNQTCQVFHDFPLTYQLTRSNNARLYFPRRIFPNRSQCCMSDVNDLLMELNAVPVTFANFSQPRDLIIDDNGYLVSVEMSSKYLTRLDRTNLIRISRTSIQTNPSMTIAHRDHAYYIASNNDNFLTVVHSQNLSILNNITLTGVNGPRAIMFLNDGQTMVISATANQSLAFFNRSSSQSTQYQFVSRLDVSYGGPHGLWRVNDSFFYVTSLGNNAVYSHSFNATSAVWKENLAFNVSRVNNTASFTQLVVDPCGRLWVCLELSMVLIYDQQGNLLGNYTLPNAKITSMKMMDNYLMYFSDWNNKRVFRLEPNIQC